MAIIRFKALEQVFDRKPLHVAPPSDKTSDYYAINVFDRIKMQRYLSKDSFNHVMDAIDKGTTIDRRKADSVASGILTGSSLLRAGLQKNMTHLFRPTSSVEWWSLFPEGRLPNRNLMPHHFPAEG
jgi:glutamine synthetase type III